jgi:hypothetical protein
MSLPPALIKWLKHKTRSLVVTRPRVVRSGQDSYKLLLPATTVAKLYRLKRSLDENWLARLHPYLEFPVSERANEGD